MLQQPPALASTWLFNTHKMDLPPTPVAKQKKSMDTTSPADIPSAAQQATTKVNASPISHRRPQRNFTTNAEDRSVLQMYHQMVPQWQSTSPWSWHFHQHQWSPLQTCHRCHPEISGASHPQSWCFTVLIKVHDKFGHHSISRTYHLIKWQYYWNWMNKDIHKYIANYISATGENTHVPTADDGYAWLILQQNGHITCHRPQCLHIRKPTHSNFHWPFGGMARNFSLSWQKGKHYCLCFYQQLSPCTHVPDSYCLTMEWNSRTNQWMMYLSNLVSIASFPSLSSLKQWKTKGIP